MVEISPFDADGLLEWVLDAPFGQLEAEWLPIVSETILLVSAGEQPAANVICLLTGLRHRYRVNARKAKMEPFREDLLDSHRIRTRGISESASWKRGNFSYEPSGSY